MGSNRSTLIVIWVLMLTLPYACSKFHFAGKGAQMMEAAKAIGAAQRDDERDDAGLPKSLAQARA